jgi:hypothetical protein
MVAAIFEPRDLEGPSIVPKAGTTTWKVSILPSKKA